MNSQVDAGPFDFRLQIEDFGLKKVYNLKPEIKLDPIYFDKVLYFLEFRVSGDD